MRSGDVERIEFEYLRHGTQCLMANFQVATAPEAGWIFITDRLDTHMSASLVQWIATVLCDPQDLGKAKRSGILQTTKTRMAYLTDATHRIRFVYTPKHASWLNQVELWFSILSRRLLKRGSFTSVEDLRERILRFINYFNHSLAKPFKWTYHGKVLSA